MPVADILPLWWTVWLLNSFMAYIALRLLMRAEELDEYITASIWGQVSDVMGIPLAIVTLILVNQIYKYQQNTSKSVANPSDEAAAEAPPWSVS